MILLFWDGTLTGILNNYHLARFLGGLRLIFIMLEILSSEVSEHSDSKYMPCGKIYRMPRSHGSSDLELNC